MICTLFFFLVVMFAIAMYLTYESKQLENEIEELTIEIEKLERQKELLKMSAITGERAPLFLDAYKKRFRVDEVTVLYSDNINNKLVIEDQKNKILALVNCDTRTITAYKKDTDKSVKIKY